MTPAQRPVAIADRLGATLYVPATHPELGKIVSGERYPGLRSVIVCLEDAIRESDVPQALRSVEALLPWSGPQAPLCFIRPRHPAMLRTLLRLPQIGSCAGFAIPKATIPLVQDAIGLLEDFPHLFLMPILETVEVFDHGAMRDMADFVASPETRSKVLVTRIGGNDLLRCLGLRRDVTKTIFDSPLGHVIGHLVTQFLPRGIPLAGAIFDGFSDPHVLQEEVRQDLAHGLKTKSASHPSQIHTIEEVYRPTTAEVAMAEALLQPDAPAVFRMHDRMNEVAVHHRWATDLLTRGRVYGISGRSDDDTSVPSAQ